MSYHRIIDVPACQVQKGDVILVFPVMNRYSREMEYLFSGPASKDLMRESVVNHHLDPQDGTYYIQTDSARAFLDPHEHIRLDCFETFGQNQGNGAF